MLLQDIAYRYKAVPLVPKNAKNVPVDLETKRFKATKAIAHRISGNLKSGDM